MNQKPVAHDGRRCPECDSHGVIQEFHTVTREPNGQSQVRSRVYECESCKTEWVKYG